MNSNQKIFDDLQSITDVIPALVYWQDLNGVVIGFNHLTSARLGGEAVKEKIMGKKHEDFYPLDVAKELTKHNQQVIDSNKAIEFEEKVVDLVSGKTKYFTTIRSPLHDTKGNMIGIIGASIEITAEKEAEELRRDSAVKQAQLEQQEKFTQVISQAVHDIRSPLASLTMLIKSCEEVPELTRIALREGANSINDIAGSLLDRWKTDKQQVIEIEKEEKSEPMVISLALRQALTSKRYQYQNSAITFALDIEQGDHFDCINVQVSSFKRMLSNIMNNAVRAYDNNPGKITLKLERDDDQIKIIISDQGGGIPPAVLDKIRQKISVTHGKSDGHGIGLIQVQETLKKNNAAFFIDSELGKGTRVTLTFPRIDTPIWLAKKIEIANNDTVVVLDDDDTIHTAWNGRFQPILKANPSIQLKHFFNGQEALDFMRGFEAKEKLFLLSDYELLKQPYNGLDIIEQTQVARSILVTSHHANPQIQARAIAIGTKILPKQLAPEVAITIDALSEHLSEDRKVKAISEADIVLVDDDTHFIDTIGKYAFPGYRVAVYYRPDELLSELSSYTKDTTFLLDYEFHNSAISGVDLAQQLLNKGYSRAFILSGHDLTPDEIPDFLTVFRKDELDKVRAVLESKTELSFEGSNTNKKSFTVDNLADADWIALIRSLIHDARASLAVMRVSDERASALREKFRQGYELAVTNQLIEPMVESKFLKNLYTANGNIELIPKNLDRLQDLLNNLFQYTTALNPDLLKTEPVSVQALLNQFINRYAFKNDTDRQHVEIDISDDIHLPCAPIFVDGLFRNAFDYFFGALPHTKDGILRFSSRIDGNRQMLCIEDTAYQATEKSSAKRFKSFFLKENQMTYPGWGFCRFALRHVHGDIECEMMSEQYTRVIVWIPS
ncbi:MAG: PAS domain-containing sensor histidine kinase [Pseudomonadota bacterium]